MEDLTIVREMRSKEWEKIQNILIRSGFEKPTVQPNIYVLTVPNENGGEKRWIVGVVMFSGEGRLCFLAVEPKHRRKGYGKLLIEHVINKHKNVTLRVRIKNLKAIWLYWKMGFRFRGVYKYRSFIMANFKKVIPMYQKIRHNDDIFVLKRPATFREVLMGKARRQKLKFLSTTSNIEDLVEYNKKIGVKIDKEIPIPRIVDIARYMNIEPNIIKKITQMDEFKIYDDGKTSWIKRFETFLYRENKFKMTNDQKNILSNHLKSFASVRYEFEFTKECDWESGDFGDRYSCWFGEYGFYRESLFNCGFGGALKIYKNNKGFGRAWMTIENNNLYFFNFRGIDVDDAFPMLKELFSLNGKISNEVQPVGGSSMETTIILGKTLIETKTLQWYKGRL